MLARHGGSRHDKFRWPLEDEDAEGRLFDGTGVDRHMGRGDYCGLEFLHVEARTIINRVPPLSRMSFRYTINVYRGCSHACTYCFARPTHEFLGLGAGEDFKRRIVVKVNAVELTRAELRSPGGAVTLSPWGPTPTRTKRRRGSTT